MSTDVRWLTSEMSGAPVLQRTAVRLGDLLKTLINDGFNSQSVTGIEIDGAGLATVTAAAHGFEKWSVVRIEGANEAALNDDWRIIAVTADTFQFQTAESAFSATGTITAKVAPLGPTWTVVAEDTNNIAIKSTADIASDVALVVEDVPGVLNGATSSSHQTYGGFFKAVESFVDFTTPESAKGEYWQSAHNENNHSIWRIFADDQALIIAVNPNDPKKVSSGTTSFRAEYYWHVYVFGKIKSLRAADQTDFVLIAGSHHAETYGSPQNDDWYDSRNQPSTIADLSITSGKRMIRNSSGVTANEPLRLYGFIYSNLGRNGFPYPEPITQDTILSDLYCLTDSNSSIRGTLPGLKQLVHAQVNAEGHIVELPDGDVYFVLNPATGRLGRLDSSSSVAGYGEAWVKIKGAWR